MDLTPTPEQLQLVNTFSALYTKQATSARVRAAEPTGFDKALWDQLLELGIVAMALGEEHAGWNASLLDLALIAEQQGRAVAPAPIIEIQTAARLLERLDAPNLHDVVTGARMVTIALHPAPFGRAGLVPAGAVADEALVLVGDRLLLVPLQGPRAVVENLGSMPIADVDVNGGVEIAVGDDAVVAHHAAVDEWLALSAAALVGIGAKALEIGVEHVKQRKAWGVPIGSFQAISHRLADSAAAIDGARLLVYEAAWAAADEPDRASELAALAFGYACESARDATYRSLHFHGGYGFTMEYDAQLYYRRARAWAAVFGEPMVAYRRAADARYGRPEK